MAARTDGAQKAWGVSWPRGSGERDGRCLLPCVSVHSFTFPAGAALTSNMLTLMHYAWVSWIKKKGKNEQNQFYCANMFLTDGKFLGVLFNRQWLVICFFFYWFWWFYVFGRQIELNTEAFITWDLRVIGCEMCKDKSYSNVSDFSKTKNTGGSQRSGHLQLRYCASLRPVVNHVAQPHPHQLNNIKIHMPPADRHDIVASAYCFLCKISFHCKKKMRWRQLSVAVIGNLNDRHELWG